VLHFPSRRTVAATTALITAVPLALTAGGSVASGGTTRAPATPSAVVADWERTSIRTIYTENASPVPVGVLYLGFTSLAMYNAAKLADRWHGSPAAAAAVAAHDVLEEYFANSAAALDRDLTASLEVIPDGRAKRAGMGIGDGVASRLIKSREHDGRNDASIVYRKKDAPGVWQPAPGGGMLAPWIGFVDPFVLHRPIRANGPDPITSFEYALDYQEVKTAGALTGADRTDHQTDTALFFNSNSAIMVGEGLLRYLDAHPLSLLEAARLFAVMHAAMTDAVITCWRLKYDAGFWRPFQAIHGADTDGNPATIADPNWAPLIPNPSYSDYVSGHGCLTSPATQAIRRTLGEGTSLSLHSYSTNADRVYPNLTTIEYDAFHARIWGGLHFRDAVEDAYAIGHQAADLVLGKLR
jgi:hypothetical protein